MEQAKLPDWEPDLVDDAIRRAEERLADEQRRAARRAVQLAREQAYHRLAVAIDRREAAARHPGQLRLFGDEPTLFDDAS